MNLPSKRTAVKFGRDLAVAVVVAAAAWVADNAGALELDATAQTLLVAVALGVYRWGRAAAGNEPAA